MARRHNQQMRTCGIGKSCRPSTRPAEVKADNQNAAHRVGAHGGLNARKYIRPPVQGEIFLLTFPYIEILTE